MPRRCSAAPIHSRICLLRACYEHQAGHCMYDGEQVPAFSNSSPMGGRDESHCPVVINTMTVLKQRGGTCNTLQDSRRVKAGGPGAGDCSRQREQQAVTVCSSGRQRGKTPGHAFRWPWSQGQHQLTTHGRTSILQQPGPLGLSHTNIRGRPGIRSDNKQPRQEC